MYYFEQNEEAKNKYKRLLKAVCGLSGIFSESSTPFIHYRAVENIFCRVFKTENLSRSDIAYDAVGNNVGIGIKTFLLGRNYSREKVAEFNALSSDLQKLKGLNLAREVSTLRNERISVASDLTGAENRIYHCVGRRGSKLIVFEIPYFEIDIASILVTSNTNKKVDFKDKWNEYTFYYSKSVLMKKFYPIDGAVEEIDADIFEDPYELLLKLMDDFKIEFDTDAEEIPGVDYVILPLYSTRNRAIKKVPEKSQLNQWNAAGRPRDPGEVYIPVPIDIHRGFPEFFPDRNTNFQLITPANDVLSAKICQANGKALMTNPNKALEQWLLRKVLKLEPGSLLQYSRLKKIGFDAVRITKKGDGEFHIDVGALDAYEEFEKKYLED